MQSHGEIILNWQGNVLIINPQGPFNEEGAVKAINTVKNSIHIKNRTSWSRLEVWGEDTLGSPTVMNSVKEFYLWCTAHGCKATAVVIKNDFQRNIIETYCSGNVGIFNNKDEATAWLTKNNYI
jgi:hypothetical protein